MPDIVAANSSLKRRIMPEAVLVCAVRLPALPAPSSAASDVLALFRSDTAANGGVIHILN